MNTPAQPDPLVIPPVRGRPTQARRVIALAAALAAVASLLLPSPREEVPVTLLVADLSQSMRAGSPPRYLLAAQAMEDFASGHPGRVGLITCASGARLASPPSQDRDALLETLAQLRQEAARPELAPAPGAVSGTRLAEGLRMAREMLSRAPGHRSVILVSDGDDPLPDDSAAQEADRLAKNGIQIQVVQVGTPDRPEPIPMGQADWLQWRDRPVRSTVNTPYLQAIATAAGTTLTTRWQPIDLPSGYPFHLQGFCLLASLILWVWFLTGSGFPSRPGAVVTVALLALSTTSCQGRQKPVPSTEALLRQAAALPTTDPARAALARAAEKRARQEYPSPASRLRLLEALILAGESVPMDRQALLAAQELALESEPLLNDRLPTVLARIRLRLAQCKPESSTRPSPAGDLQPAGSQDTPGEPGDTRPLSEPSPLGKPGKPSPQPGGPMAGAALPGTGRLPVLLDDKQPQPLNAGEAVDLLRAARRWRQTRECNRLPWERPATEVPDW